MTDMKLLEIIKNCFVEWNKLGESNFDYWYNQLNGKQQSSLMLLLPEDVILDADWEHEDYSDVLNYIR